MQVKNKPSAKELQEFIEEHMNKYEYLYDEMWKLEQDSEEQYHIIEKCNNIVETDIKVRFPNFEWDKEALEEIFGLGECHYIAKLINWQINHVLEQNDDRPFIQQLFLEEIKNHIILKENGVKYDNFGNNDK